MLWPKQVINISGTSTVLLGLFLLILKPVLRKIESTPALLNQVIVILRALSICQNWQNWTGLWFISAGRKL